MAAGLMRNAAVAALVIVGVCGSALGRFEPTDSDIDALIAAFNEKVKAAPADDPRAAAQARTDAARAALEGLKFGELTVAQIEKLNAARLIAMGGKRDDAAERLATLAKGSDTAALRAAILGLDFVPRTFRGMPDDAAAKARQQQTDALRAILAHPALDAAIKSGDAAGLFSGVGTLDEAALTANIEGLLGLDRSINADFPSKDAPRLVGFYDAVMKVSSASPGGRESLRARIAQALQSAKAAATEDRVKAGLDRSLTYVNGAYARGALVDHPAPELNFTWSNMKDAPARLSDLKGKVVVLDFWATWCGPCIGSFPDVRKLTDYYQGYPVVILGVTSAQGYHISRPNGPQGQSQRVDCKDDPAKEHSLMPEFIQQLDITWPVAFSKEEVYNPEYGVRGIPHVAIIDPKGVVRYRGLHPNSAVSPFEEKIKKIDGLLKEAGLPTPPEGGAKKAAG